MNVSGELAQLPFIAPKPRRDRRSRRGADRRMDPRRALLEPAKLQGSDRRAKDRRATGRVEVALDCVTRINGERFLGLTRDLSTFGVSTAKGPAHPLRSRLHLALHLPDGADEPVYVDAEVVGVNSETCGMRLAFRSPSAEAAKRIHRFVTRSAAQA